MVDARKQVWVKCLLVVAALLLIFTDPGNPLRWLRACKIRAVVLDVLSMRMYQEK